MKQKPQVRGVDLRFFYWYNSYVVLNFHGMTPSPYPVQGAKVHKGDMKTDKQ